MRRFHTTSNLLIESSGVQSARQAKADATKVLKNRLRQYGVDYLVGLLGLETREVSPSKVDQPQRIKFGRVKR